ncbi:unnamed protein product [Staurois parvus]|uniref:Uncharacterized protein n=1 Tax=Staurois parvus TaxID=386267 RepID=A0ABN9APP6_9NEOB|nr:unnamed protein product [Staurois parvus]
MGPLCPCSNSKKPMKKVPGASHGAPPTDLGPSGSARVSKWSVRPWSGRTGRNGGKFENDKK